MQALASQTQRAAKRLAVATPRQETVGKRSPRVPAAQPVPVSSPLVCQVTIRHMTKDATSEAVHEAGHAVIAALLGIPFVEAAIRHERSAAAVDMPREYAGYLLVEPQEMARLLALLQVEGAADAQDAPWLANHAQMAMAGALAETVASQGAVSADLVHGAAFDTQMAVKLVRLTVAVLPADLDGLPSEDARVTARLEQFSRNVVRGLTEHWPAVVEVARELDLHGAVSHPKVQAIVADRRRTPVAPKSDSAT